MPKPAKIIRPVAKNLHIPEDLVAAVDLQFFDELEGRVPHGSWQAYICQLIKNDQASGFHVLQASKRLRGKL